MNKEKLLAAWEKYHNEYDWETLKDQVRGAFSQFESEMLYSLIRLVKPTYIIEMSPDWGFTTKTMIDACNKNKRGCEIHSFDIKGHSENLNIKNGKVTRDLIVGDARKKLNDGFTKRCDFMFIDSDHSYDFGKWYSQEVLPSIEPGVLIWVHDWATYESDGSPGNRLPEFCNTENKGYNVKQGEPKAVKEFFIEKGLGKPILNCTDVLKEQQKEYHNDYSGMSPSQILMRINKNENRLENISR